MQDTTLVARQVAYFSHGWVLPDGEVVVGETVRCEKFLVFTGPDDGGYLGGGFDFAGPAFGCGIPEVDHLVVGTAAGGKSVQLPRTPSECLKGGQRYQQDVS